PRPAFYSGLIPPGCHPESVIDRKDDTCPTADPVHVHGHHGKKNVLYAKSSNVNRHSGFQHKTDLMVAEAIDLLPASASARRSRIPQITQHHKTLPET